MNPAQIVENITDCNAQIASVSFVGDSLESPYNLKIITDTHVFTCSLRIDDIEYHGEMEE